MRSSVARRLGLAHQGPAAPRNVEGLLDVMENAADAWQSPLTHERLCAWHAALFPGGSLIRRLTVGEYRNEAADPMQIVSGPVGRETVHYLAVPGAAVKAEMHAFLEWFDATREGRMDDLLRAGVAHVWFESIHPFEDGNGRIGRAIIDLALAQDARRATRLHGVAAAMQRQHDGYYDALNEAQRDRAGRRNRGSLDALQPDDPWLGLATAPPAADLTVTPPAGRDPPRTPAPHRRA